MFSYETKHVNISASQDTRYKKRNGCYPVKIWVTHKQIQRVYSSMDLTKEEWKAIHKRGEKSESTLRNIEKVEKLFSHIKEAVVKLLEREDFSFNGLDKILSKGTQDSIISTFEDRIASLKSDNKFSTAIWYECAMNSIKNYADKTDVMFSEITPAWLKGFQDYLLKERPGKKNTRSRTTVSMYQRALRVIVNIGLNDKIITESQYPYRLKKNKEGYKIPADIGRKIALDSDQINKLYDAQINPEDEKWRDLWIFSFQCNGVNFADMLRFKQRNIVRNYIEWEREKTKSTDDKKTKIRALITDDMADIIEKWGNANRKSDDYLFPFLKHGMTAEDEFKTVRLVIHLCNTKMKRIGESLGLGKVTTYWARHSFASISRSNQTPVFVISKSLGHKSMTTTDLYLDSISSSEINDNAAKLPQRKKKGQVEKRLSAS